MAQAPPTPAKRSLVRKLAISIVVLGGLYLTILGGAFGAMHLPPEAFAQIVARTPRFVWMVVPFSKLWTLARAGDLEIGDQAPDFELSAHDKSSTVRLSSFRRAKPVVLVFGSYT